MKERLLVLAKTKAEPSKKYGASMCVAGITEDGLFRRIYPIPFNTFLKNKFSKSQWIEYELDNRENNDTRKESKKINPNSIELQKKESKNKVYQILRENSVYLEDLKKYYKQDKTSIAIIKPTKIEDFWIETQQIKNYNKKMLIEPIDIKGRYYWFCENPKCTGHRTIILDSEFIGLYQRLNKTNNNASKIYLELTNKFFNEMKTKDLFFLMGNHYMYRYSWMIISIFYYKYYGEYLDQFYNYSK